MRLAIVLALVLGGCATTPTYVPTVVEKPIPAAPAECTSTDALTLKPLPLPKPTDSIADFAAAVAKIHRVNRIIYGKIISNRAVCRVYVRALTQTQNAGG